LIRKIYRNKQEKERDNKIFHLRNIA
jgi:hypothetical protein